MESVAQNENRKPILAAENGLRSTTIAAMPKEFSESGSAKSSSAKMKTKNITPALTTEFENPQSAIKKKIQAAASK